MPRIYLETFIKASPQLVFNLSRSIDLHKASMTHHREEVMMGRKTGLLEKGETVTWKANHLFATRSLQVTITELTAPAYFADEMIKGDFKIMRHEHHFKSVTNGTMMVDNFYFETPLGMLGKFVNAVFLKKYMTRLLLQRNMEIKRIAESNLWKQYVTND